MVEVTYNEKTFGQFAVVTAFSVINTGCKTTQTTVGTTTINELDLDRYLGKWYEIARYDHSFERDLGRAKNVNLKRTVLFYRSLHFL